MQIYFKDGKSSQKSTRLRTACICCPNFQKSELPRSKTKWLFSCVKFKIRLTFSGYSNYNQLLNHEHDCPVMES
jgi:hypothetical protein